MRAKFCVTFWSAFLGRCVYICSSWIWREKRKRILKDIFCGKHHIKATMMAMMVDSFLLSEEISAKWRKNKSFQLCSLPRRVETSKNLNYFTLFAIRWDVMRRASEEKEEKELLFFIGLCLNAFDATHHRTFFGSTSHCVFFKAY